MDEPRVEAFDLPALEAARDELQRRSGELYLEFLRRDSLSCGLYVLEAGATDPQEPHQEDEVYLVLGGRAWLRAGDRDADRIDSLGNAGGAWVRARRLLSFTIADQMVDLAVYVAALRDGRTVLSVLAPGDAARERARRALAGAGAHFMNFFGRFATVDVAPWRGAELPLPPWLRR